MKANLLNAIIILVAAIIGFCAAPISLFITLDLIFNGEILYAFLILLGNAIWCGICWVSFKSFEKDTKSKQREKK